MVGFVVGGFEWAGWGAVLLLGAVVELAAGEGAAQTLVEEEEQDGQALAFWGQAPAMVAVDAVRGCMAAMEKPTVRKALIEATRSWPR